MTVHWLTQWSPWGNSQQTIILHCSPSAYASDLAQCNFYLLIKLRHVQKRHGYQQTPENIKTITHKLNRIQKKEQQESSNKHHVSSVRKAYTWLRVDFLFHEEKWVPTLYNLSSYNQLWDILQFKPYKHQLICWMSCNPAAHSGQSVGLSVMWGCKFTETWWTCYAEILWNHATCRTMFKVIQCTHGSSLSPIIIREVRSGTCLLEICPGAQLSNSGAIRRTIS